MLKRLHLFCFLLLFVTLAMGCGGPKKVNTPSEAGATASEAGATASEAGATEGRISVLSLRGDTQGMTHDQIVELERVGLWMDRDIIKQLTKVGYKASLLKSRKDFKGPGHLLIIDVDKFNPGSKAARIFVGFGAGSASLDLKYQLLDSHGKTVSTWTDGVGSSRGGTYCAQTLNRNTINQLNSLLN